MGAQDLEPALVAEPLGDQGRVLDVGEQDRHLPVGRRVGGDVGPLAGDLVDHEVDRGADVERAEALGLEPGGERLLDQADHAELLRRLERRGEQAERALALAPLEQQARRARTGSGRRNGRSPIRSLSASASAKCRSASLGRPSVPASSASTRATGP